MIPKTTSVVAIIQARISSTRLSGKVLEDIAGQPMLVRVIDRTHRAKTLDTVMVATTVESDDNAIVRLCEEYEWPYFRGSKDDVLDRYYQAAMQSGADAVVRITSDCPLIEPEIIDRVVSEFLSYAPDVDYVNNFMVPSFPRGLEVEIMGFEALKRAWEESNDSAWREHVTPYIWRQPNKFKIRNIANDIDYSHMRWTVDTIEDLTFVRKIYGSFRSDKFTWREVLRLLESHPEWLEINQHIQQKRAP